MRLTAAQAEKFKDGWRAANHHIVPFWDEMEHAAKQAILQPGQVVRGRRLGGGVPLHAADVADAAAVGAGALLSQAAARSGRPASIVYWGAEVGGRWVEQRTWGGKLAENATQAAARDIMAEAMLRAFRRLGAVPCMTVHDELVYRGGSRGAVDGSHLTRFDAGAAALGGRAAAGGGEQDHVALRGFGTTRGGCQISVRGGVCRVTDIRKYRTPREKYD